MLRSRARIAHAINSVETSLLRGTQCYGRVRVLRMLLIALKLAPAVTQHAPPARVLRMLLIALKHHPLRDVVSQESAYCACY